MTNERDNSMETTGTKPDTGSGAVQVDDDANTDSGNSPPLAANASDHLAESSMTEVAATTIGTSADLSLETLPTELPETSDDEDPLRDLSPEDQEVARRLIAWARDMDAPKTSNKTECARLYPRDVVLGKVKYDPTTQGAWQGLMRAKYAQDDLRTSGFTQAEVQALCGDDFEFAYVDAKDKRGCREIRAFIEKYESLQRMPNRPTHRFVARAKQNGKLAGVIVMATGYNDKKKTWLLGEKDEHIPVRRHDLWLKRHPGEQAVVGVPAQRLEKLIARGACISWSPMGLGSALIKWAIKWMVWNTEFRVFTAYSDPEAGELGTIYRNLGFRYLGASPPSEACFDPTRSDRGEFSDKDFRRLSRYKRHAKDLGIPWDSERWKRKTSVVWENMPPEVEQTLKQAAKDAKAQCRVRLQAPKMRWAYVYGVNNGDTTRLRELFEKVNRKALQLTPPTERGVPPEYPPATKVPIAIESQETAAMSSNVRRKVVSAQKHARRLRKREKQKLRWLMERQTKRAQKREDRNLYDFWRMVRWYDQQQREKGVRFNDDELSMPENTTCVTVTDDGAADKPVIEQPMDAVKTPSAATEPSVCVGKGTGSDVQHPPVSLGTYNGTPRIGAPPRGGINGTRRQRIGAHSREGMNGNGPAPKSIRLSSVQSEKVYWLWPGRVPLGKIVLLDGDPDVGKTFITHDLAARVTTGAGMPFDDTPADPAGVVILSAEDGLADTIRPRIEAAGGDLDRIECFALGSLPYIPDDLTAIEEAVLQVEARLLIVDPLIAFLRASVTNDQRVRQAMTPIAELAERLGVAVIGIRHLTKNDRQRIAKYRGSGSIGLLGAARATFVTAPHPTDPTCSVLARSKGNLCAPPLAVTYRIDSSPRVAWLEEVDITADELLGPPTEVAAPRLQEAMDFLRDALKDGPREATDVTSAAISHGIAAKTLRDAREALNVIVNRVGFGPGSKIVWSLPPAESTSNDT